MKFKLALCSGITSIGLLTSACSVERNKASALSEHNKSSVSYALQVEEVVFDCFDVNYAWGYRLSGFFIDRQGKVYRYQRSGSPWKPKPVKQGMSLYHNPGELLGKFTNKTLHSSIDAAVLRDKIALIDNAASGAITYRNMRGADQGQNVCVAYRYDKNNNLYEQIELGSYGPTQIQTANATPAAQTLLQWLVSIGTK